MSEVSTKKWELTLEHRKALAARLDWLSAAHMDASMELSRIAAVYRDAGYESLADAFESESVEMLGRSDLVCEASHVMSGTILALEAVKE